jgi:osmoprotectant transport system ATP-binding protein
VADFIGKDRGYRKLSFHAANTGTALRNEPYAELDCSFEQAKEMAIDRWLLVTQNGKAFGWFDTHQPATAITHDNINLGRRSTSREPVAPFAGRCAELAQPPGRDRR